MFDPGDRVADALTEHLRKLRRTRSFRTLRDEENRASRLHDVGSQWRSADRAIERRVQGGPPVGQRRRRPCLQNAIPEPLRQVGGNPGFPECEIDLHHPSILTTLPRLRGPIGGCTAYPSRRCSQPPCPKLRSRWSSDEACKRTGVPELNFHDLRRTAVRNMRRAVVPLENRSSRR